MVMPNNCLSAVFRVQQLSQAPPHLTGGKTDSPAACCLWVFLHKQSQLGVRQRRGGNVGQPVRLLVSEAELHPPVQLRRGARLLRHLARLEPHPLRQHARLHQGERSSDAVSLVPVKVPTASPLNSFSPVVKLKF